MKQEKQEWKANYFVKLTMFVLDKLLKQGKGTFDVIHYFGETPLSITYGFDQNTWSDGFRAGIEGNDIDYGIDPLFLIQYLYGIKDGHDFEGTNDGLGYVDSDYEEYSKEHEPRIFKYLQKFNPRVNEVAEFSFAQMCRDEFWNNPKLYSAPHGTYVNSEENRQFIPRIVYIRSMAYLEERLQQFMDWLALQQIANDGLKKGLDENGLVMKDIRKKGENGEWYWDWKMAKPTFPVLSSLYHYFEPYSDDSDSATLEEAIAYTGLPDELVLKGILEAKPDITKGFRLSFTDFREEVLRYNRLQAQKDFQDWWKVKKGKKFPIPTIFSGLPHDVYINPVPAHIDTYIDYCMRFNIPFGGSSDEQKEVAKGRVK